MVIKPNTNSTTYTKNQNNKNNKKPSNTTSISPQHKNLKLSFEEESMLVFNNLLLTTATFFYASSTASSESDIPIWNAKPQLHHHPLHNHIEISTDEIEVSLERQQGINKDRTILKEDDTNSNAIVHDENTNKTTYNHKNSSKHKWKIDEEMPDALQNRATLHKIRRYGCDIYLLGTSHVSRKSCDDVKILMNHISPDCLFIELCPQRVPILITPPPSPPIAANSNVLHNDPSASSSTLDKNQDNTSNHDSFLSQIHALQTQTGMSYCSAFSAVLLTKVQSDYASKLNIQAGAEFQQAYQCKPSSCRVILGDRPVKVSLLRSWESLSLWGKFKLFACLLYSSIQQPSDKEIQEWMEKVLADENGDILSKSIEEFTRHFPTIQRIILNERDLYMYAKLRQTIQCLQCKKLVAVVGAGHCQGILSWFDRKEEEMDNLDVLLRGIVETDQMKVGASDFVKSLTTDVIELHDSNNPVSPEV